LAGRAGRGGVDGGTLRCWRHEREQAEREEAAPVLAEPLAPPPREVFERPVPAAPPRPTAQRQRPQLIGNRYPAVSYRGRPTSFGKLRPEEIVQVGEPPGAPPQSARRQVAMTQG
jgi:hypothetical protein